MGFAFFELEVKLLSLEIKHIMLPPSKCDFKDLYAIFELMESDLHQVIKANDYLTPEHYHSFCISFFEH